MKSHNSLCHIVYKKHLILGTRLGLISNDKFLFTYNATKAVWKKRLKVPKWFDSSTSYCVCKDNIVVVGNANRQTGLYDRRYMPHNKIKKSFQSNKS